jgi:flagellar basal body-associated protein FliL
MITFTVPAFILIAFVVLLIGGIAGYSAIFFKK